MSACWEGPGEPPSPSDQLSPPPLPDGWPISDQRQPGAGMWLAGDDPWGALGPSVCLLFSPPTPSAPAPALRAAWALTVNSPLWRGLCGWGQALRQKQRCGHQSLAKVSLSSSSLGGQLSSGHRVGSHWTRPSQSGDGPANRSGEGSGVVGDVQLNQPQHQASGPGQRCGNTARLSPVGHRQEAPDPWWR